jgi:hypothetical protein
MRRVVQGLVFATAQAGFLPGVACAPPEPPSAPAAPGPAGAKAQSANPPHSFGSPDSRAQAGKPPALNQNPKDDPASCVDPALAFTQRWDEAQRRRLDAQLATTSACYRKALQKNAALDGKLRLFVHYEEDDRKPKVEVIASDTGDCELATCIERLAATVPAHSTPPKTSFTYTLEFKRGSPPAASTDESAISGDHCVAKKARAISGRLAPESIQAVVREQYGKFRACYEQGLARDPTLAGRINVRFVINRDGSVANARVFYNEIPDCDVPRCILQAYQSLQFPKPEGGIVTVVYPIMFAPG